MVLSIYLYTENSKHLDNRLCVIIQNSLISRKIQDTEIAAMLTKKCRLLVQPYTVWQTYFPKTLQTYRGQCNDSCTSNSKMYKHIKKAKDTICHPTDLKVLASGNHFCEQR